jgi:lysophospholipase L1-like esterase
MNRKDRSALVFAGVACSLLAFVVAAIVLYSNNVLLAHADWISGKRLIGNSIMGSYSAVRTRNLLHQNRLNLGVWHGFNEILLAEPELSSSLSFSVKLDEGAYIYAIFDKNARGYSGIRLSRNSNFVSALVFAEASGEFTEKIEIPDLHLTRGWHRVTILLSNKVIELIIDGTTSWNLPADRSNAPHIVGFRSGRFPVAVDNVIIKNAVGTIIVDEAWENNQNKWPIILTVLAMCAALFLGFNLYTKQLQLAAYSVITTVLVLLLTALCYFCTDYFYWSGIYPYKDTPVWWHAKENPSYSTLESFRQKTLGAIPSFSFKSYPERTSQQDLVSNFLALPLVRNDEHLTLQITMNHQHGRLFVSLPDDFISVSDFMTQAAVQSSHRVLFLGTSQSWGSGANSIDERMAPQLQSMLWRHCDKKELFTIINASLRGSNSAELLQRYRDHLYAFQPEVVIVNLSNNDSNSTLFEDSLENILDIGKTIRAKTLLVMEPNSTETENPRLLQQHDLMARLGERAKVPVIDLHGYLSGDNAYDSGIMWWDTVHLTSYGQRKAAQFILNSLFELGMLKECSRPV